MYASRAENDAVVLTRPQPKGNVVHISVPRNDVLDALPPKFCIGATDNNLTMPVL